jgi:hypothetical protein
VSPLEENSTAHRIAAASGFEYVREYRKIEVTDLAALKAAGFTVSKPKPDYARIVEALDEGREVPGCTLAGVEYVLRPRGGAEISE